MDCKLKSPSIWTRCALIPGTAFLLWILVPAGSGALDTRWAPASGTPVFLQQPGSASTTAVRPALGGGPPSTPFISESVLPHSEELCSIRAPRTPNKCSVNEPGAGGPPERCTAHTDSGQTCSAFRPAGPVRGNVYCSTLGIQRAVCSVLQPSQNVVGGSFCSAANARDEAQVGCSVIHAGGGQFCSAENSNTVFNNNYCSAILPPMVVVILHASR